MECAGGPVQARLRTGAPVTVWLGGASANAFLDIGAVRGDVTAVVVRYTNGQSLGLRPVSVFGSQSARYVVIASPYPGTVVSVTAFAGDRDLGYAVPFTGTAGVNLVRWLRPGQPARPRPVTQVIGTGSTGGSSWHVKVAMGPSPLGQLPDRHDQRREHPPGAGAGRWLAALLCLRRRAGKPHRPVCCIRRCRAPAGQQQSRPDSLAGRTRQAVGQAASRPDARPPVPAELTGRAEQPGQDPAE